MSQTTHRAEAEAGGDPPTGPTASELVVYFFTFRKFIMNTTFASTLVLAAAAVAGTFAGSAFAESPLAGGVDAVATSSRIRADVQAEMRQAKAAPNAWSISTNHAALAKSVATRAQVQAELQGALASGEYAALHMEDGDAPVARVASGSKQNASNTTAQVRSTPAL
jgi:hypothetical protein